jgi:hypothetical protein
MGRTALAGAADAGPTTGYRNAGGPGEKLPAACTVRVWQGEG